MYPTMAPPDAESASMNRVDERGFEGGPGGVGDRDKIRSIIRVVGGGGRRRMVSWEGGFPVLSKRGNFEKVCF